MPADTDVLEACTCAQEVVPGCSLHDPVAYLCQVGFHRVGKCKRTGRRVSWMDAGEAGGVVVLFVLPSGCTRWVGVQLEPLARRYGIRLIAIDRPGCGGTPMVPLDERIDKATDMTVSVLEHLGVRPRHILVASGGIYYALRHLTRHPQYFLSRDSDGNLFPRLYNLAPWSPVLRGSEAYFQPLNLIPTPLIKVQHQILPTLLPALEYLGNAFEGSSMLLKDTRQRLPWSLGGFTERQVQRQVVKCRETWEGEHWGPGAADFISAMIHLENQGGIGQEHLICLDRGCNTGAEWFQAELGLLACTLAEVSPSRCTTATRAGSGRLQVEIWWGDQDGMVPKQGREWLNKLFASKNDVLDLSVHRVKDGNHNDLIGRRAGIGQVLQMVALAG